ncbi:MAG TPA: response regulator transcription factor, partial [Euzebyales bacterium]|nr:response regulator transcription factor [Euzebyales bacterium]
MTIRVVVAADQELVRSGFVMILDAQPDIAVVAEAADGTAAVEAARRHMPDVVLLDIRMPNLDGIEAARVVCAETPCRVIMLTTFDLDEYMFDALDAGASGFLLKDVRRDDLVHAVRVVARGDALLAPSATRRLIAQFVGRGSAEAPARVSRDAKFARRRPPASPSAVKTDVLTAREHEILELLARGMSNAEMAAALVVSEHTVKTH